MVSWSGSGVTRAKLAAVGQQVSSGTGSYTQTSTSASDVTGSSVTITTTGRPVVLALQPDGAATGQMFIASANVFTLVFLRGASEVGRMAFNGGASNTRYTNAFMIDAPGAGTYTYKIQCLSDGAVATSITHMVLFAYEL